MRHATRTKSLMTEKAASIALLAATMLLSAATQANAGDKNLQLSLSQRMSWDSNPLMVTSNEEELFGSITTPMVAFSSETPTMKFTASSSVDENIFDDSNFNSTDLHSGVGITKRVERWEAGLRGKANYDTTRTSELTTLGINVGSIRHLGYSVSPDISFSPNTLNKISLNSSFLRSTYDSSSYTDYDTITVSPSYSHYFSPTNTGILSVRAQRYEADNRAKTKIDSVGPSLGWASALTPEIKLNASAGMEASRSDSDNAAAQPWEWNSVFSAGLSYTGETNKLSMAGSRNQQPYANGTQNILNTFSLSCLHDITQLLSLNGSASYQYSDSSDAGSNLKALVSTNAGLSYHATDQLDFTTYYSYKNETLKNTDRIARENVFMIGLVYRPLAEDVSW